MRADERFYKVSQDFRDPFSRDRDRVIHSSSFRRLEYKTQVFINHVGDYFRTRLTHSIEVSQVARSLAKHLGLNESLAEVIALSHDLGHTPFGHVGGDELDLLLKADGFQNGFEHNFQSFRTVHQLENRYKEFRGLNLAYGTLEGLIKHSYPYKKSFYTDWHIEAFDLDYHPSLEAVIVDFSDEIAYVSHDIDDGVKYGLINFYDLLDNEIAQIIHQQVTEEGIDIDDKIYRYRFVGKLINFLVFQLLQSSDKAQITEINKSNTRLHATETLPIKYPKNIATELKKLKKILFEKLYRHEAIAKNMFFGKQCVTGLYKALMSDKALLPNDHYIELESKNHHRVVADYIASMTDRHASNLYKELYFG
ncbi:MAG: dNTP triphosphohydrolase [Epsilonproteobacteria bacterium]|nr:dNTP triphosphohydrolase [Campylobacterota bacterium]